MDKIATILIVFSALVQQVITVTKLPNPFVNYEQFKDGYFVLKGVQYTATPHKQPQTIQFENYFSFFDANSFIIYTDDTGYSYTILYDTWRDTTYIIQNSTNEVSEWFDCEIDHVHNHQHIYPWIYEYIVPGLGDIMHSRGTILGPGAIWLNALAGSTYVEQSSNVDVWTFETKDLHVQLAFDIVSRLPAWFEVLRFDAIDHANDSAGGTEYTYRKDRLIIESVSRVSLVRYEHVGQRNALLRLQRQLNGCRGQTNGHRVFPSLLKRLTQSSRKSFGILYERYTSPLFDALRDAREANQRSVKQHEFVNELFSLEKSAQLTHYYHSDTYRTHKFLKFFIDEEPDEAKKSALVNGHGSMTTYYHIIANGESLESCRKGEREFYPNVKILTRPVHFTRFIKVNGSYTEFRLTGHLNGLIALLLNAGNIHYKEFNLHSPLIESQGIMYHADEWIIHDKNSSWDIHFYFKRSDAINDRTNWPYIHDIDRLLQVDIRDARTEPNQGDNNILMSFFVRHIPDDFWESELYDYFRVPHMCTSVASSEEETLDDGDDDDDLTRDSDESELNEDYIMGHGTITERDMNLPSLIDAENVQAYEIVSRVFLKNRDSTTKGSYKGIYIREIVDLDLSSAAISIHLSKDLLAENVPYVTYIFRYTSDALFAIRHNGAEELCQLVDEVDEPWLRLLSSDDYRYYIHLPESIQGSSAIIQSDRLKLYGVGALWDRASSSPVTTTFGGIDTEKTIRSGGYEYNPAYFGLDHLDMSINFDFLYNRSMYREDKNTGKHHPMIKMLHLRKINIVGKPSHTDFEPVDVQVLELNSDLPSRQTTTLPESCQSSITKADQELEKRYEQLLTMPQFEDFVGDGWAYYAKYDLVSDEHMSETITELFDRNEKGWINIEGDKDNLKQIFIDWNHKLVFDYNDTTGECVASPIDQQSALEFSRSKIKCDADRSGESTSSKYPEHSLAALWIQLSRRPMRLRSKPFSDRYERRLISYIYVSPVTHEGELIEVEFRGKRKSTVQPKSELVLSSIRSRRPHLTNSTYTGIDVLEFDNDVESHDSPELPKSCAKFIDEKDNTTPTPVMLAHKTIPNPFDFHSKNFYLLKGSHTVRTPHKPDLHVSFENYFSLASGISYTIFEGANRDDLGYAILTDTGVSGKTYRVRNPRGQAGAVTDCELDYKHSHKHVFPWRYDYEFKSPPRRVSIFGPGAIWLNFIDRNIDTNNVLYTNTNISTFQVDDLVISLAFSRDTPKWFNLQRLASIDHTNGFGVAGTEHSYQSDSIHFESFDKALSSKSDTLRRMRDQLETCVKSSIRHRVFPNLLKQLLASSQRSYKIRYRKQTFPRYREIQLDQFDAKQHRYIGENETVTELFSWTKEAQSTQYDYYVSSTLGHRSDTFLKLFTDKKTANGNIGNNTTTSTTYYHISRADGIIQQCLIGEREPPSKHKILVRPIRFHRLDTSDLRLISRTGHLTGMIALLLNAADIHYKEFRLQTKTMRSIAHRDPFFVDEWIVHDKNSSWDIHFYFKQMSLDERRKEGMEMTIDRLMLVEIRDPQPATPEDIANNSNLFISIHVHSHQFEFVELRGFSELDSYFKVPNMCSAVSNDEQESEEEDGDQYENADDFDSDDQIDDDSEAEEEEDAQIDKHEHKDAADEDSELGSGTISENNENLPDLNEYLDNNQAYEIVSRVTIQHSHSEPDRDERIFLRETLNQALYTATLSLYLSEDDLIADKPQVVYWFRYRSDALYVVRQDAENNCRLIDDVEEPWLRLMSTGDSKYYIDLREYIQGSQTRMALIRSTRLRFYGVGALWKHACSSGAAENVISHGKSRRSTISSDGCEYHAVHWTLRETSMIMNFRFLYNQTRHREARSSGKRYRNDEMLSLDWLRITESLPIETIDIQVLRFRTNFEDKSRALSESCQIAESEADRALQIRYKHLLTMPKFKDFVGEKRAYYASYEHSTSFEDSSKKKVIELFNCNQGWIKLEGERQYFIDRKNNYTLEYQDSTKECKRIALHEMSLELVPTLGCDTDNPNPDKSFGLAALWMRLSDEPMILHVQQDSEGRLTISYVAFIESMASDAGKLEIEVNFSEKQKSVTTASGPSELVLKSIRVKQQQGASFYPEEPELEINVETIYKALEPMDLPDLPEACAKLIENMNRPTPEVDDQSSSMSPIDDVDSASYVREHFPRLSPHLGDKFLMQSEVAIRSGSQDNQSNAVTYQLHEWYLHSGGVRLRSHDLKGKNMDLLFFPETNEYFDLSTPYRCENNRLPVLKGVSAEGMESKDISESKLARFWTKEWTVVDHPSELYYGAMGLWRLAEKNLDHVKLEHLADDANIAISPDKKDYPHYVDIEAWKVHIPGYSWSYELYTAKYLINNLTRSFLEGIIVTEESRQITIDVVNYRYDDQLSDLTELFSLPIGYGCERSEVALKKMPRGDDVFVLDTDHDFVLSYEATLEVVKGKSDINSDSLLGRQLLPTFSGEVIAVGRIGKRKFDISAQTAQINYRLEATSRASRKIVTSRSNKMRYEIDQMRGSCHIESLRRSKHDEDFHLELEFPSDDEYGLYKIDVPINTSDNRLWFDDMKRTNPIVSGADYSIYEQHIDYLKLSTELRGRAAVIRTFTHGTHVSEASIDGSVIRKHDKMQTKVMLFDREGANLQAVLVLSLYVQPRATTSGLLQSLSIKDCFNDRNLGSYKISYERPETDKIPAELFYERLISTFDLDLDQLDGRAQVEFNDYEDTMEIEFNVWEPIFDQYFDTIQDSTMLDKLEHLAMIMPAIDVDSCFNLCHYVSCLAISYCKEKHNCRLLSEINLLGTSNAESIREITLSQSRQGCVYRYLRDPEKQPVTLGIFRQEVFEYVHSNRSKDHLQALSIEVPGYNYIIQPIKFVDLTRSTYSIDTVISDISYIPPFLVWDADDYKIDLRKLNQLNKDNGTHFRANVSDVTDCAAECDNINCVYLSYCRRDNVCTMITNGSDIHLLRTGVKVEADPAEGCIIEVRESSFTYDHHYDTNAPKDWTRRLNDYTEGECAAVCDSDENNCTSFDYCSFVDHTVAIRKGICLLQSHHRTIDTIRRDRSEFSLKITENIDGKDVICTHYSKSFLSNFERARNRRFKSYSGDHQTVRGLDVINCAAICIQDECEAFEHCQDSSEVLLEHLTRSLTKQSCRFLKTADEPVDTIETDSLAKVCSVYTRTENSRVDSLEHILHSDSWIDKSLDCERHGASSWIYPIYLSVAVVVGSFVQIVYVRIWGESLLFH